MKLEPGFYKIQRGERHYKSFHYWRVFVEKGALFLQEDNAFAIPLNDEDRLATTLEEVQILKKYIGLKPPECNGMKITIEFDDEDNHHFKFASRNKYAFRSIFNALPWIKKKFE